MNMKGFYPFLGAKTLMALADVLYIMTVVTYIYDTTKSATLAALYPLFQILASLIAGFTTPLLLEKFRFNSFAKILALSKPVLLVLFALVFPYISMDIPSLLVFIFVLSFVSGWLTPLLNTIVPKLVDQDKLVKANSYLTFSNHTIQIAGYSFTGVIVTLYGTSLTLTSAAVFQIIATISFLITLKSLHEEPVKPKQSKWETSKEGWLLLWNNKTIRMITTMDIIEGIAGAIWIGAITLVFVKEAFDQGADWWGFINTSYYVGTILGGLLALVISKKVQEHLVFSMAIGSFLFSVLTFLYGINSVPWIALALCVLMGPAYQIRDIAQQTALQTSIPTDSLPKMYAARSILMSTVVGLSVLLVGIVTDLLGVRMVYILAAVLICFSALLSFTLLHREKSRQKIASSA